MARKTGTTPAAPAGFEAIGTMVHDAVRAQRRSLEVTQGWSESVLGTLKEQAESYGALLRSVDASMRAMEQAIKSQAETTKALAESLEASRQIISTAVHTQEQSVDRVENFIGGMLSSLTEQMQALRGQLEMGQQLLTDPLSAPSAFVKLTQDWMDAYGRMLSTVSSSPQHGSDD